MPDWVELAALVAASLVLLWLRMLALLWRAKPDDVTLREDVRLVPDFIPVLGYADDVVVVAIVLRSVVRAAGPEAVERHWPGTPEGLRVIRTLCGTR